MRYRLIHSIRKDIAARIVWTESKMCVPIWQRNSVGIRYGVITIWCGDILEHFYFIKFCFYHKTFILCWCEWIVSTNLFVAKQTIFSLWFFPRFFRTKMLMSVNLEVWVTLSFCFQIEFFHMIHTVRMKLMKKIPTIIGFSGVDAVITYLLIQLNKFLNWWW